MYAGLASSTQPGGSQDPPLLAVVAVVGDYESAAFRGRLRKAWYPGGSRQALEDCLGKFARSCVVLDTSCIRFEPR